MRQTPENIHVVNLVHAMLGAVSPNWRCVSVESTESGVRLHFLLERDDDADRAEISEVEFEFQALHPREDVQLSVAVSCSEAAVQELPGRRVFLRRE
jgi:hypothetical protein